MSLVLKTLNHRLRFECDVSIATELLLIDYIPTGELLKATVHRRGKELELAGNESGRVKTWKVEFPGNKPRLKEYNDVKLHEKKIPNSRFCCPLPRLI
jgi:hypothetical protein